MDCRLTESEQLERALAAFREDRARIGREGIGRLAEKSLHGVLKFLYDPDPSHHEVSLPEGTVADVFDGETVTEIQTGNYAALQKKLPRILPYHPVQVVCPIVRDRYLYTVDLESGTVEGGRRSPLHGSRVTSLLALAHLDCFLDDPNFALTFLLLDTAEYRTPRVGANGKRVRQQKLDRLPLAIVDVWNVTSRKDYEGMLPVGLCDPFTAADFYKASRLRGRNGSAALKLLRQSETVLTAGNVGRAYLYTKKSENQ